MGEIVLFTPFCLYHCLTSFPHQWSCYQRALTCSLRRSGPCFPQLKQQRYRTFLPPQEAPRRQDRTSCHQWLPFSHRPLFSPPLQSNHLTPTFHAALAGSPWAYLWWRKDVSQECQRYLAVTAFPFLKVFRPALLSCLSFLQVTLCRHYIAHSQSYWSPCQSFCGSILRSSFWNLLHQNRN